MENGVVRNQPGSVARSVSAPFYLYWEMGQENYKNDESRMPKTAHRKRFGEYDGHSMWKRPAIAGEAL